MTQADVIEAAVAEARAVGLPFITRDGVAARLGIPAGSLGQYGTMDDIKQRALAREPELGAAYPCTDRHTARKDTLNDRVLSAAIDIAIAGSYLQLTRQAIADKAGVSAGTVSNYAGGMDGLREAVLREAIKRPILTIVAQGIAVSDPLALAAPLEVRQAAIDTMRI